MECALLLVISRATGRFFSSAAGLVVAFSVTAAFVKQAGLTTSPLVATGTGQPKTLFEVSMQFNPPEMRIYA